jgi:hypothetical protein
MRTILLSAAVLAVLVPRAVAQSTTPAAPARVAPATPGSTQQSTPLVVPPAAQQIAAAVLPLPDAMRAGARVWGYGPDASFIELRPGTGAMTCIADDPRDNRFHVACYHNAMEPYMARGRELRAQGVRQPAVDSIRYADVAAGRIHMPTSAALYSLTGPASSYDAATNTATGASPLYVLYLPGATAESTGLPDHPNPQVHGQPWIMHPGQPAAHLMMSPNM